MEEKRVIIFDIDDTLSNSEWRRHLFEQNPRNWEEIREQSLKDKPHHEIHYLNQLVGKDKNNIIIVLTARSEEDRDVTKRWLDNNAIIYHELMMREKGDFREDYIIKENALREIELKYSKPYMAFEDNINVAKMWRKHGIRCLHVKDHEYYD